MSKYKLETSSKFEKQYKKLLLDDKEKSKIVINKLLNGDYKNYYECHIKPDLLLIYQVDKVVSILSCIRFGSHADLFK